MAEAPEARESVAPVTDSSFVLEAAETAGSMDERTRGVLGNVIDNRQIAMVTRNGRMAALIIPMTLPELLQRHLDNSPELVAQLQHAAAHLEEAVPASSLFEGDFDDRVASLLDRVAEAGWSFGGGSDMESNVTLGFTPPEGLGLTEQELKERLGLLAGDGELIEGVETEVDEDGVFSFGLEASFEVFEPIAEAMIRLAQPASGAPVDPAVKERALEILDQELGGTAPGNPEL